MYIYICIAISISPSIPILTVISVAIHNSIVDGGWGPIM